MLIQKHKMPIKWWLGLTVSFLLLAILVKFQLLTGLDELLIKGVQANTSATKDFFFKLITILAQPTLDLFYAALIAGFLWFHRHTSEAIWVILTIFGGDAIASVVKKLVARQRPAIKIILPENGYSFPSGHVLGTTIILLFICVFWINHLKNKWQQSLCYIVGVLLLLLVSYSRVYLGAHYPSDVLGAILLALIWGEAALWLYQHYFLRLQKKVVRPRHAKY
ncbi:hypothetical protein AYR54_11465 [Loigolactobacillus backii]|uniref:Uncharacterized protein n=1 Tax=Loigolactobacillus backii TaxID=375175 RepID=A0A192H0U6_9LACO|nr:phosphatase PAP2 family protein [Loigolactobacillus backii]ANK60851.1 hypothetical protein AYR52_11675 [Loigolactobacillus backii]ANK61576.1 hypothetical protein AYR53_01645 [Loigolactobacillus backii]ANK65804.1 hypothetical protein AYR54_11465 [Loigolactobacillus backii]ANK68280.1 hypothetical protein AYR55_11615 [Loigolactobacillus backii]ANK69226.1 hypothetical protein AYR56_03070 [Loigolactobacillus backii]